MTGGLRGLIANSRAQTPRLRPRPVGRFESGGMNGPDIDTETVAPVRSVEQPAPERVEATSAPRTIAAPVVAPPAPPIMVRDSRVREPEPVRSERRAAAAALRPSAPIRAAQAPASERREAPTVAAVQHVSAEQPVAPRRSDLSSDESRPEPPARHAPRADHERGALVSPPLPAVQALVTPRTADRKNQPALQSVSTSAPRGTDPVVQVSIGRIEVRTTAPATETATRSPATRSAVVGLDDYLNQRGAR